MNNSFVRYIIGIGSLSIFSNLKNDPVISALRRLLEEITSLRDEEAASDQTKAVARIKIIDLYSNVIGALYPHTSDISRYIRDAVLADDNFYIENIACGKEVDDEVNNAVKSELIFLEELAGLLCSQVIESISDGSSSDGSDTSILMEFEGLPRWTNSSIHLIRDFSDKLAKLPTTGYGLFSKYDFFRVSDGNIVPVPHPDIQPLTELYGYERQKEQIIKNTEALLSESEHTLASNMLLYGDAGTGKSSTIKAVAAEYVHRGLRLIEIKKDQLLQIPMVLESISRQPLKFILFVDDLSFTGNDDNFSALKATLEGSVAGRGENAVIYATSNRRHLIKETFADRTGDELHVNDTLQETMSLAARFGLTVIFEKPDKDEYLDIVMNLAKLNNLDIADDELIKKAEAHAIRKNGRSPRTARQFIELLKIGL